MSQRLAQLTEGRSAASSAVTAPTEGDGGDSSSDEEMDPQEALAAVRRLTRSLLPMMLGPRMLHCPPPCRGTQVITMLSPYRGTIDHT